MTAYTASSGRRRGAKMIVALVVTIALLAAACVYLLIHNRQTTQKQAATPAGQIAKLTAELQSTILLPDEQPTIATVLDRTKLGNKQLVAEAKNGDSLLIYAKKRRLILYRPSTRQVVDMFHVETPQAAPTNGTVPKR